MDTNMENTTLFDDDALRSQETVSEPEATGELKAAIEKQLSQIRTQSMLLGAQSLCQIIVQKIYAFESTPGKKSANDYKRLIKDIKKFVETGLSRKVNLDGTTEEIVKDESETTQN